MQWLTDFINNILGPVSIVVGILTIFPVLWTWWEITFGRQRQHRRWFSEVRSATGERPGILIVDLLEKGKIANDVESFRRDDQILKAIPSDRVFKLERTKGLYPSDMPGIAQDLRQITEEIIEAGIDTIHFFYAGPVIPATLIGAEFANVRRVLLYQRNRNTGHYENWGPLRHLLPNI
jgi:SMODS-associated and fused to various effectors sensor domain